MASEIWGSQPAPPWAVRVVVGAIGVVACVAYLAGGRMGIGSAERDYVFSPADQPQSQSVWSAREVPIGRPPTPSTIAARFSLAIARGRRTALRDLAAVTAACSLVFFAVWLRCAGVAMFPTALATIGLFASATSWWRGTSWTGDAVAPALALLALCCLWRWWSTRGGVMAAMAIGAGIAAVADELALGLEPISGRPSLAVLVSGMSHEFTTLGLFLVVIGISVLVPSRTARVPAMITAAVFVVWQAVVPRSPLDVVSVPMAIAGWAAIAVGLAWMLGALTGRTGVALATAATIMLLAEPALTRGRLWALGQDLPSTLAAQKAFDLSSRDVPERAAFVAESRRADAAILLSSRQAGRDTTIVPQSPDALLAAARDGRTVFAFARARANLERLGFVFDRDYLGNAEVGVMAGQLPCVELAPDTWRDVSLHVARGSFTLHGMQYGRAPGGVIVRATDRQPVRVTAIEPRSIPFDVSDTASEAERITTIHVSPPGRTEPVVVTLDASPAAAVASAEHAATRLCAGMLRGAPTLGRADRASAALRMNEYTPFGTGWHPIEADPDFFRWTGAPDASVRVTVSRAGPVRITVTATPAARPAQHPAIGLTVNGCRLATQPMPAGLGDFEWIAGESCWLPGVNQLWIHVTPLVSPASLFATHDTRLLGARIGAIRLARVPETTQNAK